MNQRSIILAIVLFVIIVGGMFTYALMKRAEINEEVAAPAEEVVPSEEVADASISRISAKHFFIDGVHTLVGEIPLPTPCDLLDPETVVAESYPEQVTVNFNVINNDDTCIQVVTPARFKVSVEVSEDAVFRATYDGVPVEFNLVPALEGETPDDFEIYTKG